MYLLCASDSMVKDNSTVQRALPYMNWKGFWYFLFLLWALPLWEKKKKTSAFSSLLKSTGKWNTQIYKHRDKAAASALRILFKTVFHLYKLSVCWFFLSQISCPRENQDFITVFLHRSVMGLWRLFKKCNLIWAKPKFDSFFCICWVERMWVIQGKRERKTLSLTTNLHLTV